MNKPTASTPTESTPTTTPNHASEQPSVATWELVGIWVLAGIAAWFAWAS